MGTRPSRRWLAATAAVAVVAAASCGSDDGSNAGGEDAGGSAAGGGRVVLVTHDSFALSEGVLEAFTDETGLEVEVVAGGDAVEVVNRAILTSGDPEGDVLFGVDGNLLTRVWDVELFTPYESPALASVPSELVLDPEHRVTPIDHGEVCLNVDLEWFDAEGLEPPDALEDLTEPAYEGLTVVQDPSSSTPGLAFLLATVAHFGEDGWADYWAALRDNDVAVGAGWEDTYYGRFSGGSGEGDRPIVVSYATSPVAEVVFADPRPEEAPTGVVGASCVRQVEFAGVLDGAANPEGARLLIDFLLSELVQEDIPLNMFVYPARDDVALPPEFVEHAEVPADVLELSPEEIGANREAWVEEWTTVVLR